MKPLRLFVSIVLAIAIAGFFAVGSAQGSSKLVSAYSSLSATQAAIWLANDAGGFRRHGLDVELIYIGTGTKMMQALVGGDIGIGQVGGSAPLGARLRGAEVKIIDREASDEIFHHFARKGSAALL